jgi:ATP/maltotriose-dependent transcriptional regulator MalT
MPHKKIICERPRLDKLLSGIASRPLTVVAATAGFGKPRP